MKFRKLGQIVLASVVSLGMAGLTACVVQTGDFVYVTSSKNDPGQINVYKDDINSGTLKVLKVSPYTMRYRNPVALVVSQDGKYLYVAYRDDNVIQEYGIGTDGKIYPQNSYNTPGAFPISLAINSAGTYLYALDTYQPGFSDASPGPGALVAYPIKSDGSLSSPITNGTTQFYGVGMVPTILNTIVPSTNAAPNTAPTSVLVNVLKGDGTVLVSTLTKSGTKGAVYAFSVGSGGALAPLGAGDASLGSDAGAGIYGAGTQPSAITSDLSGNFAYVTDFSANKIWAYSVQSSGLTALTSVGFATGNNPISITIEPRNKFMYVANFTDGSLNGFQIGSNGALTGISGGSTVATTGAEPTCVFVEPRSGRFVYTTDFLGNTVTGFELNPSTGALDLVQKSPFPAAAQPTCGTAIPHGKVSLY